MKRLRLMAVVGALLAIVGVPIAYASGLWFGLPVVGGSTYCSGTVGTGTSPTTGIGSVGTTTTCATTVPAGPTSTTGLEMIPADLQVGLTAGSGGPGNTPVQSGPTSAYLPLGTVASGAYFLTNPAGLVVSTISIPNGITNVIVNATGTITSLGVLLPTNPYDGQIVRIGTTATITTVSLTPNNPTSLASIDTRTRPISFYPLGFGGGAGGTTTGTFGATYLFNLSSNTWLRLQ